MKTTTRIAMVLTLFVACDSTPTAPPPSAPTAQPAAPAPPATATAARATTAHEAPADHVHVGPTMENVLAEGEYAEGDIVSQPGASIGDVARCPVSGEVFTISEDSAYFDHEGGRVYFCCPTCVRPFQRDPAGHLARLAPVAAPSAEGTRYDPPVAKDALPGDAWICDMGTVHYARSEQGDGRCPLCGMNLTENPR